MPSTILAQRKLRLGHVLRLLLIPAKNQVLCSVWPDTLGELREESVICVDSTVSQRPIEDNDCTHCEVHRHSELSYLSDCSIFKHVDIGGLGSQAVLQLVVGRRG